MADHGTDVDPRAEAALEALRRGRAVPDEPPGPWWEPARRLVDATGWPPARVAAVGVALVAVVLVGGLAALALRPMGGAGEGSDESPFSASAVTTVPSSPAPGTTTLTTTGTLVVHAAGAVRAPGVYQLASGARVADLLDAAGGPTADTDLDRVNLAAPLADGQRLYVPRKGEDAPTLVGPEGGGGPAGSAGSGGEQGGPSGPIDLNRATLEELDTLPGVGPSTAQAIVDHRERNGPFASVDGLLDVRGIGPAKLEALRDLVTVG